MGDAEELEKMKKERDELCHKINVLDKLILNYELKLPKRLALMEAQLKSMKDYLFYLEERIHLEIKGGNLWAKD